MKRSNKLVLNQRFSIRSLVFLSSTLMAVIIFGWFSYLNFSNQNANAAVTGDYQTAAVLYQPGNVIMAPVGLLQPQLLQVPMALLPFKTDT
jgi:hypothetical protein